MPSIKIDKRDLDIIRLLLGNSRLSAREIARRLGISTGTVQARMARLEANGVIKNYTITLDMEKLGYQFPVIMDIRVSEGKIRDVEGALSKLSNVYAVYDVTGEYDISVIAWFRERSQLDSFIKTVNEMEYVERTNTKLILNIITEGKLSGYIKELGDYLS